MRDQQVELKEEHRQLFAEECPAQQERDKDGDGGGDEGRAEGDQRLRVRPDQNRPENSSENMTRR